MDQAYLTLLNNRVVLDMVYFFGCLQQRRVVNIVCAFFVLWWWLFNCLLRQWQLYCLQQQLGLFLVCNSSGAFFIACNGSGGFFLGL